MIRIVVIAAAMLLLSVAAAAAKCLTRAEAKSVYGKRAHLYWSFGPDQKCWANSLTAARRDASKVVLKKPKPVVVQPEPLSPPQSVALDDTPPRWALSDRWLSITDPANLTNLRQVTSVHPDEASTRQVTNNSREPVAPGYPSRSATGPNGTAMALSAFALFVSLMFVFIVANW